MTARRVPLVLCAVAMVAGFTHAALTTDPHDVRPAVQCFEDGSCDNGHCEPGQLCDEARYAR